MANNAKIHISRRLSQIAVMVKHDTVVDIGTDHGHLPIYLLTKRIAKAVLATDINSGPLLSAQKNIESFEALCYAGLSRAIKTKLADGLLGVNVKDYKTCIISGMGGNLIMNILNQSIDIAKSFDQLILSPQKNIADVRMFLHQHGFCIDDEVMLEESGRYYNILDVSRAKQEPYSSLGYAFGEKLIQRKCNALKSFVEEEIAKTNRIIKGIKGENANKTKLEEYLLKCKEVMICLQLCSK